MRYLVGLLGHETVRRHLKRPTALEHALAVNALRAKVEASARDNGLEVLQWRDESDLAYLAGDAIVPDAFFEVQRLDGQRLWRSGFLVEAELALESRQQWRRRLDAYLRVSGSRKFEEQFGLRALRLLCITDGGGRQVRSILEEAEARDFLGLRATSWQEIQQVEPREMLFAPVWHKPGATEPVALYDRHVTRVEEWRIPALERGTS